MPIFGDNHGKTAAFFMKMDARLICVFPRLKPKLLDLSSSRSVREKYG